MDAQIADPGSTSQADGAERRLLDFAAATSDWFWEMGADLRFRWFSSRFEEIAGVPESALLGRSRRELLEGGDPVVDRIVTREDWWNHVAVLERHESFRDFVHPREHPDKGRIYLSISGTPFFDNDGTFAGYRGGGREVTREIMVEQELLRAKDVAEQANLAKTAFLANMSHELRTPLNAIIGFAELIEQEVVGPIENKQYPEYAGDIRQSGRHLLGIINDILDIAKIEASHIELSDEVVPLQDLIEGAMTNVRPQANSKQIDLQVHVSDASMHLRCDERRMGQILVNLLSNAVKFTEPGGTVSVEGHMNDSTGCQITVTDTGIGMSAAELKQGLEPFGQAAYHTTRGHEGTGLGLNIADSLCRLHGGTLHLESTPGVGTSATLNLPRGRLVKSED
ncbi:MAG: PAS domain-containing sensor histidine kinase [Minwuia sp.]|nr:PAS domain-containing sensor histidine kinase [Minwuia sp.]